MRITHINTFIDKGGAAKSTMRLAAAQRALGHEVHVLTAGPVNACDYAHRFDPEPLPELTDLCREKGLLYYEFQGSHKLIDNDLVQASDIVHCSNLHGKYFNPWSLSALSHAKPVVWTLRDMQSITGYCAHSMSCEKWRTGCGDCPDLNIYPKLSVDSTANLFRDKKTIYDHSILQIVAPADWLRRKLPDSILQNQPVELIYNGCDTNTFRPYSKPDLRRKWGIPQDAFVIGSAAHGGVLANFWKGGSFTQMVWEEIKKLIPNSLFLNIGSSAKTNDPRLRNIEAVQDETMLAQIYNVFDLFLYTPVADTCPLVVLETLSCGVPIVTFDTGGVPELARDKMDGFVFKQGDTDSLITAVLALYGNPQLAGLMGQNARQGAVERFSIQDTAVRYIELYSRSMDRHKQQAVNPGYFDLSRVPEIIKTPAFLNAEKSKTKKRGCVETRPIFTGRIVDDKYLDSV